MAKLSNFVSAFFICWLQLLSQPENCSASQALSDANDHNHTDHFGAAIEQSMRM
uniref:Secreted protein n=1 Tax=Macrostomum lignano TaxID=282301 RepID=A0A1I8JCY1_9PLAT